jgi:hypothetical protein
MYFEINRLFYLIGVFFLNFYKDINNLYLAAVAILNFPSTKIHRNLEENHPRNIPAKFDSKWPSGFRDFREN